MYHPSEKAVGNALDRMQAARDQEFAKFMAGGKAVQDLVLKQAGIVAAPGESIYSLACRYVDQQFPEVHFPGAGQQGPPFPGDTGNFQVAQPPHNVADYADLIDTAAGPLVDADKGGNGVANEGFYHTFMLPGLAFVGYRLNDSYGTVETLSVQEIVALSGLRPDGTKSSVVIVDLSSFFDVDYIRNFVFGLYAALSKDNLPVILAQVEEFLAQQGWMMDAEQHIQDQDRPTSLDDAPATWQEAREAYRKTADDATQIIPKYEEEN